MRFGNRGGKASEDVGRGETGSGRIPPWFGTWLPDHGEDGKGRWKSDEGVHWTWIRCHLERTRRRSEGEDSPYSEDIQRRDVGGRPTMEDHHGVRG